MNDNNESFKGELEGKRPRGRLHLHFRNSNCVIVRVNYVEMSTVQCVTNTLFLTLDPVYGSIKL